MNKSKSPFAFGLLSTVGLLLAMGLGCGDRRSAESSHDLPTMVQQDQISDQLTKPSTEDYEQADFRVLFIGNSHTSTNQMPKLVEEMLNRRQSKTKVYCEICAAGFLAGHLASRRTTDLIKNKKWDVVVLQAQKYSSSGKYEYPTDAAVELTEMATSNGARVIMYPEWGQRMDDSAETTANCIAEATRVHELHESIVQKTGATLAPVGLVWNEALQQFPKWTFHSDGNHANRTGAFLTAVVFERVFTAVILEMDSADQQKPFEPSEVYKIDEDRQKLLFQLANKFVSDYLNAGAESR